MNICRFVNLQAPCTHPLILSDEAVLLDIRTAQYYSTRPEFVDNRFMFLQMGDEFVWKFKDCGYPNVVFPMDRLPEDLQNFLLNELKISDGSTTD